VTDWELGQVAPYIWTWVGICSWASLTDLGYLGIFINQGLVSVYFGFGPDHFRIIN
jgi:hypothetical protein